MSRKIYNRLSFMAVSWLDESTLAAPLQAKPLRGDFSAAAANAGRDSVGF
jgi:hypothetical protein